MKKVAESNNYSLYLLFYYKTADVSTNYEFKNNIKYSS